VQAEGDHSKVSQFTLQHFLREQTGIGKCHAAFWAAAAGMHDGAPHWRGEWAAAARSGIAFDDEWEKLRRNLAAEFPRVLGTFARSPSVEWDDFSALWQTAGLITVADWIGSDETFFSPARADAPAEPLAARAAAKGALKRIGMEAPGFAAGMSFQSNRRRLRSLPGYLLVVPKVTKMSVPLRRAANSATFGTMTFEELKAEAAKLPPDDRFALAEWIESSDDVRALRHEELIREIQHGIEQADRGELLGGRPGFLKVACWPAGDRLRHGASARYDRCLPRPRRDRALRRGAQSHRGCAADGSTRSRVLATRSRPRRRAAET
jgi:hypothetical protein